MTSGLGLIIWSRFILLDLEKILHMFFYYKDNCKALISQYILFEIMIFSCYLWSRCDILYCMKNYLFRKFFITIYIIVFYTVYSTRIKIITYFSYNFYNNYFEGFYNNYFKTFVFDKQLF